MPAGNRASLKAARGVLTRRVLIALAAAGVMAAGPDLRAAELYFDWPAPLLLQRPTTTLFYSKELEDETRAGTENERKKDYSAERVTLNFRTNGWVYHPLLVTFNIKLAPEFIWRKFEDSSGRRKSDKVDFFGYSVGTTWLKAKPYTINIQSQRDRRDSSSSLANDVTTKGSADSVSLLLKNRVLPTTLTYSDSKSVTEGFFRTEFSQQRWELDSRMKTEKSETKLRVADMQQERIISGSGSASDRFLASLVNNYTFNAGGHLNTTLNFADLETGEQSSSSNVFLNSQLDLPLRRNLHSFYSVNLSKTDIQEYSSRSASLSAGLGHRLYENLKTSITISGGKTAFPDGDIMSYGGNLNFAYTRRIPWGVLSANLGMSERIQDNQTEAGFVQVHDESHTFDGISTTIILDNINVDPDSIELMDTSRAIIYVRGIDYEVDSIGRSTIITRDPFAGIGDDETVLAAYRHAADPPAKTGLTGSSYGMQLLLWESKFRLYYLGNRIQERLIEGLEPFELRFDRTERMGAQLNLRWSVTGIEFEDRGSTTTPLKRLTVTQNFNFRPWPNFSLNIGGQLNKTELTDTGEEFESRGANIGIGWSVGPGGGQLQLGAFTRENRNIEEEGFKMSYRWRYGAWFPLVRYEYTNQFNGFAGETRKRERIYFEVKRRFR